MLMFQSDVFSGMRLRTFNRILAPFFLAALLGACSTIEPRAISGPEAYNVMPPAGPNAQGPTNYLIGPLDVLSISVFQEKDLSLEEVPVDAGGNILFPLIGQLQVAGRTSPEVSAMIAGRLEERFLVDPQVTVLIKASVSQKVTVDGEVRDPGVYPLQGQTSLIQAMAMAKGLTNVARLNEVLVFRTVGGTQYVARFDLEAIRKGLAPDPLIQANDTVVVGFSRAKAVFRDFLGVAPALASGFVALVQITR